MDDAFPSPLERAPGLAFKCVSRKNIASDWQIFGWPRHERLSLIPGWLTECGQS